MRASTSSGSGQSSASKSKANGVPITTVRNTKKISYVLLLFTLVFVGTFTVLRTVVHFFGVHESDIISIEEVQSYTNIEALPYNPELSPNEAREEEKQLGLKREKIPRIIHQTWKNEILPEKWDIIRKDCIAMLPGFDFKLWTDAGSREFIATEYPSFLPTWDSYLYTIQRADAIRYFVLHKYGGIYMDLDIGCRAHPGPLLHFESILPITKPVGVSNDLMFSAPKTPFMDLVINSLETFNHQWLYMPYPTVMFSTGPMFISAIYSMWCRILQKGVGIDPAQRHLYERVRILPKSLYGKNILPEDAPHSFYWHYYGSSWHAGDAGFIGFLGKYGYRILLLGSALVFIGFCYLVWSKRHHVLRSPRYRKVSLDPFENLVVSPPITNDAHMEHLSNEEDTNNASFIKSKISHLTNLFHRNSDAVVTKGRYIPLSAVSPTQQIRQRSNTVNSDSMDFDHIPPNPSSSSSMLPASPNTAPPRRKPRVHPIATRPHSRQRSRDIERGFPIYTSQIGSTAPDQQTSWTWPDTAQEGSFADSRFVTGSPPRLSAGHPQANIYAEPGAMTPPLVNQELPSMFVTGPSGQISPEETWASSDYNSASKRPAYNRRRTDVNGSASSNGSSASPGSRPRSLSYQRPPIRPTSSQNGSASGTSFTGRINRNSNTRVMTPPVTQDVPASAPEEPSSAASPTPTLSNATTATTTTDGEVSASELMDTLGDLESIPNTSNNSNIASSVTRTGISTPGERAKDAQSTAMRKRSLSSEGERFS